MLVWPSLAARCDARRRASCAQNRPGGGEDGVGDFTESGFTTMLADELEEDMLQQQQMQQQLQQQLQQQQQQQALRQQQQQQQQQQAGMRQQGAYMVDPYQQGRR